MPGTGVESAWSGDFISAARGPAVQILLNAAAIIGSVAGVVGLVVSWRALRASLRAEAAAETADRAAVRVHEFLRVEGALSALFEVYDRLRWLERAVHEGSTDFAGHFAREARDRMLRWQAGYYDIGRGRMGLADMQVLCQELRGCADAVLKPPGEKVDWAHLRASMGDLVPRLAGLIGTTEKALSKRRHTTITEGVEP